MVAKLIRSPRDRIGVADLLPECNLRFSNCLVIMQTPILWDCLISTSKSNKLAKILKNQINKRKLSLLKSLRLNPRPLVILISSKKDTGMLEATLSRLLPTSPRN